ncbi:MAG: hypothetical protein QW505_02615 [Thermoplasmata archaeon]
MYLDKGSYSMFINFSAATILEHGEDPSYVDLQIWNDMGDLVAEDQHILAKYFVSDFEFLALFSGGHQDFGVDENVNGMYELLVVRVVLDVYVPGQYTVEGVLNDSYSNVIEMTQNETFLDVGTQIVELAFFGATIYRHGEDGPYEVALRVYDQFNGLKDEDTHTTQYYVYEFFEHSVLLTPFHSDYGYDVDSDGLYEWLVLVISLQVEVSDWYRIDAIVYSNSTVIATESNRTLFDVSTNKVNLTIAGILIYCSRFNGSFLVELRVRDLKSGALLDSGNYSTIYYHYDQFDGANQLFPPYMYYGRDLNGNGLFETLVLDIDVSISTPNWYYIWCDIYYWDIFNHRDHIICMGQNDSYLTPGLHHISLEMNGGVLRKSGVYGWLADWTGVHIFLVSSEDYWWFCSLHRQYAERQDSSWVYYWYDMVYHYTEDWDQCYLGYNYSDFEPPSQFQPPHDYYLEDRNGNGLFEYITVEASLNITCAGYYEVWAELWLLGASEGWDCAYNFTYLELGQQIVRVSFTTYSLAYYYIDGPYEIRMKLYPFPGSPYYFLENFLDNDSFITSSYNHTSFEMYAMLGAVNDQPLDSNGNGFYDWLVINASIFVSLGSLYQLNYHLYDSLGKSITSGSLRYNLDVGERFIEIPCNAQNFFVNGYDGPYQIELSLYRVICFTGYDVLQFLESRSYLTYQYNHSDFEPPAILFSPHSHQLIDASGDENYDTLLLGVRINVSFAGTYKVSATLVDAYSQLIGFANVSTALNPGIRVVTLTFDGRKICEMEASAPFTVIIELYWSAEFIIDDIYLINDCKWTDFEKVVGIPLRAGWNFVIIPLCNFTYKASTLGLSALDIVCRWNSSSQAYDKEYVVGFSGSESDFAIEQGKGYWIWVSEPRNLTLSGGDPRRNPSYLFSIDVPAEGGWVALGMISISSRTASEIASFASGANVLVVSKWDSQQQAFVDFIIGFSDPEKDFIVNPGEAVWLFVDGDNCEISYVP